LKFLHRLLAAPAPHEGRNLRSRRRARRMRTRRPAHRRSTRHQRPCTDRARNSSCTSAACPAPQARNVGHSRGNRHLTRTLKTLRPGHRRSKSRRNPLTESARIRSCKASSGRAWLIGQCLASSAQLSNWYWPHSTLQ